jgi:carboxyl-terminal processing protease
MKYILLLTCLISCSSAKAQQINSEALHQKVITVRRFLEQNHYQPLVWNDTNSTRLYNKWLDLLDDDNLLFRQSDIDQLSVFSKRLDDELLGREWNFYDKSIGLYKTALTRADSLINSILAKPFDFSKVDNITWPLTAHASDNNQQYKNWHQYLKWQVIRSITDKVMDSVQNKTKSPLSSPTISLLEIKARGEVKKRELAWVQNKLLELSQAGKDLENDYLSAIAWCYDPHSDYMSADTKSSFDTEMSGLEYSAGFEVDENDKGEWIISYLVPGGAAWRNGELHKGDIILKIKSGDKPELILAETSPERLSGILEGSSNEKITITVRTLAGVQKAVQLEKEKITDEEGIVKSYVLNGSKKIGYITLPGFYVKEGEETEANGCSNDLAKEVVKLKKDSIAGLILDLRYNGGGSLGEALELAGIFINEGSLASTKDKTGKVRFLRDPNRGTVYDGPLLVMVNTMSASASELVSAVLQDYHRALIVGSPTYGKGSSQLILPLDTTGNFSKTNKYDSYVKVTEGKFYRIDGSTTQWKGVFPDIELPDIYAIDRFREKGTISSLLPDNAKPAIYNPLPAINFEALKLKSNARVKANGTFSAISKFSEWSRERFDVRSIPLQWNEYFAYYNNVTDMFKTIDADSEENSVFNTANNSLDKEKQLLNTTQSNSVNEIKIKRISNDAYIAECYKIMQDWLK